MSYLSQIATEPAPYRYTQEELCLSMAQLYGDLSFDTPRLAEIVENSQVKQRYFIKPLDQLLNLGSFVQRNQIFFEEGLKLSKKVIQNCLDKAQISAAEVDGIIFVSSTGFVVPTLDSHLINELGFPAHTRRWPIFGWGCTGGVAGLELAYDYTQAHPSHRVLVLCLELCSLAFQEQDLSKKALIASTLFNDGAAVVLVEGEKASKKQGTQILRTHSHLFPLTPHVMGWDQTETGLQVVLSPEIPQLVLEHSLSFVRKLLGKSELSLDKIQKVLAHPGGAKVIKAVEEAVSLTLKQTQASWTVLNQYGNMSSCSIFYVLQTALEGDLLNSGFHLMLAFGPGFSAEGILLQC